MVPITAPGALTQVADRKLKIGSPDILKLFVTRATHCPHSLIE